MAFVADNSVIIAWFVPSQANALTREAWLLARKEQVHVPAMWQPEFAAVQQALERRGLLPRHQVDAAISKVERFGLEVHGPIKKLSPLVELARSHGIKPYDACYLDLAISLGIKFYTRDAKLRLAARAAGIAAR
ncbi:MAG: type II toxin-antitoxin system VapC family toxin [Burkholderiales bacterium]